MVIGAGFTGLSAALHLAEGGARVAVLEAAEIGFGGSGRNVGLVNAGLWIMPDEVPSVLGALHGERLLDTLGNAPRLVFDTIERLGIACEAERQGTLHCAVGPAGLAEIEQRAAQWQARRRAGPGCSTPPRRHGASAPPPTRAPCSTSGPAPSSRSPMCGASPGPRSRRARACSGRSPATAAVRDQNHWRISTRGGSVRAPRAIVATNAYTGRPGDVPWALVGQELVPLPYFQFATQPLGHNIRQSILPERQGVWDTKEILSSYRFDRAGRLVFGSVGALRGLRDWRCIGPGRSVR